MPQPRKYQTNAQRQAAYRTRTEQATKDLLTAKGLPALPAIPSLPGTPRWRQALTHAQALVQTVISEMESYHDQRSDQWQMGERAQILLEHIAALSEAHYGITQVIDDLK